MNSTRFDSLSRRLAESALTRRSVVKHGGAGLAVVAGLGLAGRVAAQDATPSADVAAGVELLFIQSGGETTLEVGSGGTHTLTVADVTVQTLYFTDRPARAAGTMPTEDLVATWAETFGDDPPNATLIGHLPDGEEAVVLELMDPVYDAAAGTLSYTVRLLDAEEIGDRRFEQEPLTALEASRTYVEAHLFIDSSLWCFACTSVDVVTGVCFAICDAAT